MKSLEKVFERLEKLGAYAQYGEYCEPGYTSKEAGVLFGDWNPIREKAPGLLKALEERFTLDWSDKWTSCEDCGKYFLTSGDSYSWTMYGWISEHGECLCRDCVKESPEEYIAYHVNNPKSCIQDWIDLAAHGFKNMNGTFENGLHAHMNDNPVEILKEYRAKLPGYDFVFGNLGSSQFYIDFEIWGKEKEK